MGNKELLATTHHRPWPLPVSQWGFYQEWNRVVFLHWKVDEKDVRPLVPDEIEIDTFEGDAWVSAVAFSMERTRPRQMPAFAPVSNFPELNIRTYIKYKGRAGGYFLSIEAGNRMACVLARQLSGMPYRHSYMSRKGEAFIAHNHQYGDSFQLSYSPGKALEEKTELDLWLTERYSLSQESAKGIRYFDVHHAEWPVQEVAINDLTINYPRFVSLFNGAPDKCHYSSGVQVLAWHSVARL